MICPYCNHKDTEVKNSRPHKKNARVWRRRSCPHCKNNFTTDETPRFEMIIRVSSQDKVEEFNYGILISSIIDAFHHDRAKGQRAAWDLAQTVIDTLIRGETIDVSVEKLRTICHGVILRYDRAAGIQYAISHHLPF